LAEAQIAVWSCRTGVESELRYGRVFNNCELLTVDCELLTLVFETSVDSETFRKKSAKKKSGAVAHAGFFYRGSLRC
jgi:hypothetical protein